MHDARGVVTPQKEANERYDFIEANRLSGALRGLEAPDLREHHVRQTEPAWQALQKVLGFEYFVGSVVGTDGFEEGEG
jgi:hypothetical protein